MNMKKIFAVAAASALTVSSLAVFASAEDIATAQLTWADGVASFYWGADEAAGIENNTVAVTGDGEYTITANVEQLDEDGFDVEGGCTSVAVLALDLRFADGVKIEETYPDARVEVTSVKLGDTELALDFSAVREKLENPVGDSANNYEKDNILRQNIYNDWGGKLFACELPADLAYETITVSFKVTGLAAAADPEPAGDETTADDTTAPDNNPAEGSNPSGGDGKDPANTGIEGVAVVAGLAVLATGAIVIAKKRK